MRNDKFILTILKLAMTLFLILSLTDNTVSGLKYAVLFFSILYLLIQYTFYTRE